MAKKKTSKSRKKSTLTILREAHDEFLGIPLVQLERERISRLGKDERNLLVLLELVPYTTVFRGKFTLPPNYRLESEHDQWPGIYRRSREHYIGNGGLREDTLDFLFNDTTCTIMPPEVANKLLEIGKIDPRIVPERRARFTDASKPTKHNIVTTPDYVVGFLDNCILNNHPDYRAHSPVFDRENYFERYHKPDYFTEKSGDNPLGFTKTEAQERIRELDQERIDKLRKFLDSPYKGYVALGPMARPEKGENWPIFAHPNSPTILITAEAITGFSFLSSSQSSQATTQSA